MTAWIHAVAGVGQYLSALASCMRLGTYSGFFTHPFYISLVRVMTRSLRFDSALLTCTHSSPALPTPFGHEDRQAVDDVVAKSQHLCEFWIAVIALTDTLWLRAALR